MAALPRAICNKSLAGSNLRGVLRRHLSITEGVVLWTEKTRFDYKEEPVRRIMRRESAGQGLSVALVAGLTLAQGSELKVADQRTGKAPADVKAPAKPTESKTADCGCTKTHGTSVQFYDSPS